MEMSPIYSSVKMMEDLFAMEFASLQDAFEETPLKEMMGGRLCP
jgi:hypothetical protein